MREPPFSIFRSVNIHSIYAVILKPFREKRLRRFLAVFSPASDTQILDVGGTRYNWTLVPCEAQITLLNLDAPSDAGGPANLHSVQGDGTDLKYGDGKFDICFSNSVIEHLGTFEKQRKFAQEVRRVGRKVWVQTPARTFFLEPHLLAPFIHYFPKGLQRKLLRNFTVWGWMTRPKPEQVDGFLSEVRLLGYQEMKSLFPDCEVHRERFLGFTKSYVAVRK